MGHELQNDLAYQMNRQFWGEHHPRFIFNTYINSEQVFGQLLSIIDSFRKTIENYSVEGNLNLDITVAQQQSEEFQACDREVRETHNLAVRLQSSRVKTKMGKADGDVSRKGTTAKVVVAGGTSIRLISNYAHQIGLISEAETLDKFSPYSSDIDVMGGFHVTALEELEHPERYGEGDAESNPLDGEWYVHWPKGSERQPLVNRFVEGLFELLLELCSANKAIFAERALAVAEEIRRYEGYESCEFQVLTELTPEILKQLELPSNREDLISGPFILPDSNIVIHACYEGDFINLQVTSFFQFKGKLVSDHILEFIYPIKGMARPSNYNAIQLQVGEIEPVIDQYGLILSRQYRALKERSQLTLDYLVTNREWGFIYGKCSQQMARLQFLQNLNQKISALTMFNPLSDSIRDLFSITPTMIQPAGAEQMVNLFYCCPFFQLATDSRNHCRQIAEGMDRETLASTKKRLADKLRWMAGKLSGEQSGKQGGEQKGELSESDVERFWELFVAQNYNFYRTALVTVTG